MVTQMGVSTDGQIFYGVTVTLTTIPCLPPPPPPRLVDDIPARTTTTTTTTQNHPKEAVPLVGSSRLEKEKDIFFFFSYPSTAVGMTRQLATGLTSSQTGHKTKTVLLGIGRKFPHVTHSTLVKVLARVVVHVVGVAPMAASS